MVFKWCGRNSLEQGEKKGVQHPARSGSFFFPEHARKAQSCATIDRGCSEWWLPPSLMPHLQHGLDFQLHCQVRIQAGIAVLAQATVTDLHASPTLFPDPWALFGVGAS